MTKNDRAFKIEYVYNDIQSLEDAATEEGDDLAAIFASPFKHDTFVYLEILVGL